MSLSHSNQLNEREKTKKFDSNVLVMKWRNSKILWFLIISKTERKVSKEECLFQSFNHETEQPMLHLTTC